MMCLDPDPETGQFYVPKAHVAKIFFVILRPFSLTAAPCRCLQFSVPNLECQRME